MQTDAVAYRAFTDALNSMRPGWTSKLDGIHGPEGALVQLVQEHDSISPGHVDVRFVFDTRSLQPIVLIDCVVGFGATHEERAACAAHIWSRTTATALFEVKYSLRGEYANHYHSNDPGGLPGWHVVVGSVIGFGEGDSPDRLQEWFLKAPLLTEIAPALTEGMDAEASPRGVKIFFGGDDVAEVRIDGQPHTAASDALARLLWPRLVPPAFVRSYAILLHSE